MKTILLFTFLSIQYLSFGQSYVGNDRATIHKIIRESFKNNENGIDILKSSSSSNFEYYVDGQTTYKQMYDKDSICTSELIEIKSENEAQQFLKHIKSLKNCGSLGENKWKYVREDGKVLTITFKSGTTSYCTIKETKL